MKRLGLFLVLLVLALGVAGVGFAQWEQQLFVNGTVYTAEMTVDFTAETSETDPLEISTVTATVVDDTLTITIDDAYPLATYTTTVTALCTGAIPVDLDSWNVVDSNLPEGSLTLTDFSPAHISTSETSEAEIIVSLPDTVIGGTSYSFSLSTVATQSSTP